MRKRRRPRQARARLTVEAMLDAVTRVLKRHGVNAVTTNRIAEAAGVSIGSIYQYFPDKSAIFVALHARHVEQVARSIETTLIRHAAAPLAELIAALIDVMTEAHVADPALHQLLFREVPHRAASAHDLEQRLRDSLRLALAARSRELSSRDLDRMVFVVATMLEALAHAAVLERPPQLSLAAAKQESVRAILAYLT